jgi:hypothetical protein
MLGITFLFASTLQATTLINYTDTYAPVPVSSTLIGLEYITTLPATSNGTAHANGFIPIPGNPNLFIANDRASNVYTVDFNGNKQVLLDTKTHIGNTYISNNSQRGLQYSLPHYEFNTSGASGFQKLYTVTTESANPDTNAKLFSIPSDLNLNIAHYDVISGWGLVLMIICMSQSVMVAIPIGIQVTLLVSTALAIAPTLPLAACSVSMSQVMALTWFLPTTHLLVKPII